jgi:hypothetical protein
VPPLKLVNRPVVESKLGVPPPMFAASVVRLLL